MRRSDTTQDGVAKASVDGNTTIRIAEVDEITPLLSEPASHHKRINNGPHEQISSRANSDPESPPLPPGKKSQKSILPIISVLLIGVFISQADTSLVLSTYPLISSHFSSLTTGSWLLTSYMLSMCIAQPLFGKLSDIYGRKPCLQTSYILFAIGTAGSGLGQSMTQVVAMRAVQGAGGAGMVCMVSILLTDLVELGDVAMYRGGVNVVQTVGRSCGGAIGGALAGGLGWRWAFLIQCPPTILAILLVQWKLDVPGKQGEARRTTSREKLGRIDFLGAFCMSLTILTALLVLDMGGQKYPYTHPLILVSIILAVAGAVAFCFVEKHWAKEPIFPLQLLTHYVVVTSYSILSLQNLAQSALMFIIPVYFQVTMNASPAVAGLYLVPAVAGNMIGGLMTGLYIQRTGRYKLPTIIASISSGIAFALLIALWRGHTSVAESLVVFPGGFATGIAHSAVFIGLTSGVDESEIAIAGSGLYLSGNVGAVLGISSASAVYQMGLQTALKNALSGREDASAIIEKALSDISYIQNVRGSLRDTMIPAYITAIRQVFILGLASAAIALVVGLITREKRLAR